MPRRRRHDDELKQRLLDVAAERIARHGLDGLGLRALAEAAGTSTTAVYSLFGGKRGLLSALHERAFRRFGSEQAAVGVSADPVEDVVRLGLAYRRSAIGDPHGYRIMFGDEVVPTDVAPELRDAAAATFLPLLGAVRRCIAAGRFRDDMPPPAIATALWANVHGLVSLELGRFMPPMAGEPAVVFEAAVRAAAYGWTAGSGQQRSR